MSWKALIVAALAALVLASGCGESEDMGPGHMDQGQMQRHMKGHRAAMRARMRHRAMMARRHHRQMMRRHRQAMRRLHAREARRAAAAARAEETAEAEASECDPNYSGACLDPYASDYDCEGGSGNGPDYTGEVTVIGVDHYGLDADGDGIGCESE
ncbi:MAG TPA: hypothetical protein VFX44_11990 [Solirubrobacterales bacterium]|nr:hypothetical protein [Solirubrobacterales bacterium]